MVHFQCTVHHGTEKMEQNVIAHIAHTVEKQKVGLQQWDDPTCAEGVFLLSVGPLWEL